MDDFQYDGDAMSDLLSLINDEVELDYASPIVPIIGQIAVLAGLYSDGAKRYRRIDAGKIVSDLDGDPGLGPELDISAIQTAVGTGLLQSKVMTLSMAMGTDRLTAMTPPYDVQIPCLGWLVRVENPRDDAPSPVVITHEYQSSWSRRLFLNGGSLTGDPAGVTTLQAAVLSSSNYMTAPSVRIAPNKGVAEVFLGGYDSVGSLSKHYTPANLGRITVVDEAGGVQSLRLINQTQSKLLFTATTGASVTLEACVPTAPSAWIRGLALIAGGPQLLADIVDVDYEPGVTSCFDMTPNVSGGDAAGLVHAVLDAAGSGREVVDRWTKLTRFFNPG